MSALYKRSGPGPAFKVVGNLNLGDIVSVYEVKDGWYRVDPTAQLWCSGKSTYLQRLKDYAPTEKVLFKAQCIVTAYSNGKDPEETGRSLAIC